MKKLLALLSCLLITLAVAGCEKKEDQGGGTSKDANQAGSAMTTDQNATTQSAQAGGANIDQIREQADTMSESQLRQSAQQVATQYKDTQTQLQQRMQQLRSGGAGGMIAGSQNIQQDVSQLKLKAQNLGQQYEVYASKLKEKGVTLPALQQMQSTTGTQDMNSVQDQNATQQSTGEPTDANKTVDTNSTTQG